ncbi:MAG: HAD-IA family hydrolase [Solirubrobacterales bacterium]
MEAVVFDWDGTLVDTKRVLVGGFQGATEELLGEPFPVAEDDVEEIVQLRGEEAFALIDEDVTGDEVAAAKPDPEGVVEVIRRLGAEPAATLYVGDGPNDVHAGRGAGAVTVAVSFGFHPAEAVAAAPDHVIEAMPELLAIAGLEPAGA